MRYRQNIPFRVGKVCALIAAALVLPVLAYADQNSQGQDQGNKVPDGGPGNCTVGSYPWDNPSFLRESVGTKRA
jgi:hypothetical protein